MTAELRVDWQRCTGHGLCHELVPEIVDLDEWGYPIILESITDRRLHDLAKRAVSACPALALRLDSDGPAEGTTGSVPFAAPPIPHPDNTFDRPLGERSRRRRGPA
ncbi:MAG: ferredoxin [Actinomycetota bacterium]